MGDLHPKAYIHVSLSGGWGNDHGAERVPFVGSWFVRGLAGKVEGLGVIGLRLRAEGLGFKVRIEGLAIYTNGGDPEKFSTGLKGLAL